MTTRDLDQLRAEVRDKPPTCWCTPPRKCLPCYRLLSPEGRRHYRRTVGTAIGWGES